MNKQEWEDHYTTKAQEPLQPPDTLLTDNRELLTGGTALDIAMGSGRNAFSTADYGGPTAGLYGPAAHDTRHSVGFPCH